MTGDPTPSLPCSSMLDSSPQSTPPPIPTCYQPVSPYYPQYSYPTEQPSPFHPPSSPISPLPPHIAEAPRLVPIQPLSGVLKMAKLPEDQLQLVTRLLKEGGQEATLAKMMTASTTLYGTAGPALYSSLTINDHTSHMVTDLARNYEYTAMSYAKVAAEKFRRELEARHRGEGEMEMPDKSGMQNAMHRTSMSPGSSTKGHHEYKLPELLDMRHRHWEPHAANWFGHPNIASHRRSFALLSRARSIVWSATDLPGAPVDVPRFRSLDAVTLMAATAPVAPVMLSGGNAPAGVANTAVPNPVALPVTITATDFLNSTRVPNTIAQWATMQEPPFVCDKLPYALLPSVRRLAITGMPIATIFDRPAPGWTGGIPTVFQAIQRLMRPRELCVSLAEIPILEAHSGQRFDYRLSQVFDVCDNARHLESVTFHVAETENLPMLPVKHLRYYFNHGSNIGDDDQEKIDGRVRTIKRLVLDDRYKKVERIDLIDIGWIGFNDEDEDEIDASEEAVIKNLMEELEDELPETDLGKAIAKLRFGVSKEHQCSCCGMWGNIEQRATAYERSYLKQGVRRLNVPAVSVPAQQSTAIPAQTEDGAAIFFDDDDEGSESPAAGTAQEPKLYDNVPASHTEESRNSEKKGDEPPPCGLGEADDDGDDNEEGDEPEEEEAGDPVQGWITLDWPWTPSAETASAVA